MRSMVAACPNLQEMELCSNGGLDDVEPAAWQRGLACLTGLSRLTSLKLDAMDMNMGAGTTEGCVGGCGMRGETEGVCRHSY